MPRKGFIALLVGVILLIPAVESMAADGREKGLLSGIASYYASRFHGRRTASGEIYDRKALTAAHPSLPFGTLLRVFNIRNGRSIVVRVNDRGPFHAGRIIDVSWAAARALGLIKAGKARVKLEILHLPGKDFFSKHPAEDSPSDDPPPDDSPLSDSPPDYFGPELSH